MVDLLSGSGALLMVIETHRCMLSSTLPMLNVCPRKYARASSGVPLNRVVMVSPSAYLHMTVIKVVPAFRIGCTSAVAPDLAFERHLVFAGDLFRVDPPDLVDGIDECLGEPVLDLLGLVFGEHHVVQGLDVCHGDVVQDVVRVGGSRAVVL
jgi:hypothetical protein